MKVGIKTYKDKKCKACGKSFTPSKQFQVACDFKCAIIHSKNLAKNNLAKKKRKETKIAREKLKTRHKWLKEAQSSFNAFIRERDKDLPCISCGIEYGENKFGGNMDCGHYRSIGSAPHLRFNTCNAHKQCVKCNRYLSSNAVEYRKGLINKIGSERVDSLECLNFSKKYDIDYLKRVKYIFNKKTRLLKRRNQ